MAACFAWGSVSSLSCSSYEPQDRAILARYVSNIDDNVYCITNLPEEVVAVIFAYVSRSEHSFRDNLLRLLRQGDIDEDPKGMPSLATASRTASEFHSRWVVGYGHSSVAEHSVAHVGVEGISRIASAELELSNRFLSFTEYSQRYQKPRRGGFYMPPDLPATLARDFVSSMNTMYDIYEELYTGLVSYLEPVVDEKENESTAARQARIARIAFEDARYALPLATLTSLGLTGNGRALRDSVARLRTSTFPEVKLLADKLAREVTKALPTLLRHANPTSYQLTWWSRLPASRQVMDPTPATAQVQLIGYTGYGEKNPEAVALQKIASAIAAQSDPVDQVESYLQASVSGLGPHDMPPEAFHWVRYDCALTISEAAWHQLLRHCRGMHFQWGPPEIGNGYTVPPNVAKAGFTHLLERAIAVGEEIYRRLQGVAPELAGYAVTNAHRRRIRSEFDLYQLYHLVNLRTTEQAQWDIRNIVFQLWQQVLAVHPRLAGSAARRDS